MKKIGYLQDTRLDMADKWIVFPFLLLLGISLVCIPVHGQAQSDTQIPGDTNTTIWNNVSHNQDVDADFGIDSDYTVSDIIAKHQRPVFAQGDIADVTEDGSPVPTINHSETMTGNTGGNVTDLQLTWQRCLGGSSYEMTGSLIQTVDGGYLIGGYTYSNDGDVSGNHGYSDIWIVKLDASKNKVWQRCLGGSDDDYFTSVVQTSDGGYLINGDTYSNDENVTGNHGNGDIWIVKLDSAGNISWQKCLGGTSAERSQSAFQTTDGGYLVSGYTRSTDGNVSGNHGNWDIWEVKLDSAGDMTWQKCLGGTSTENPKSAIQTTDGGYLVSGYTYSNDTNVTGNHGYGDIWEVKLDSVGNMTWEKCLGGTSDEEPTTGIIQTTDGGYLVSGYTYSNDTYVTGNHGYADIWEVKLDPEGNMTWQKCLGGTSFEYPEYAFQTPDGGYLITGYTYSEDGNITGNHGFSDIWVVKLDSVGNMTWEKCLGGSMFEEPNAGVIQTTDGRYLVGGYTESSDGDVAGNHGDVDFWMALLTASHPITATADSWTIAYPPGTESYTEGTNATYLAEPKPGADLVNVSVDDEKVGPVSNWTFSAIDANHTFATTGQATPGQVHAFFTLNTTWGSVPLTVQFTNQSLGNPTSFSWNFGDGGSSTESNPIHTYTVPGTYSVTLLTTNAGTGGVATLTNALTATAGIVPSPTPTPEPGEITAAFTADLTSGTAPMQVLFVDQSTGNPTSWLWDLGDGDLSASQNVTHIYKAIGTYSVSLTASNSIYSSSIEKSRFIVVT